MKISDKDLLLAILAMDSYNQGHGSGIEHNQRGADKKIGIATVRDTDIPGGSLDAGFNAASYKIEDGSSIEGLETNDIIISYRGTDNPNANPFNTADGASDLWNGWVSGAGFPAGQSALAFKFFEAVTGVDAFEGEAQDVILTGHSLGGGLAGLVASITGDEGVLFDNMPYAQLATLYAMANAASDASQSIASLFSGEAPENFAWPNADNITNYYLEGEALVYVRSIAHLIWPGLAARVPPILPVAALVEGNALVMESQETTIKIENALELLEFENPINLHSQQLKPIMMFGNDLGETHWHHIVTDLYDAWFNNDVGEAVLGEDGIGIAGGADPASKLRYLIAYSILDEGSLVFGNTGIRAMFDDANELGKLVEDGNLPSVLEDSVSGVTEVIVQFAAQMGLNEVRYQDHQEFSPEKGFLGLDEEQTVLKLDLSRELWNLGGDDPDKQVNIKGVQSIIDSFFGKLPDTEQGPVPEDRSELLAAMALLYGTSETGIVDRIDFALGEGDLTLQLEERGENTGSYNPDTVSVFTALDGNDDITGNSDNNILVGGKGDDRLIGGLGKDIIIGGLGSDVLVDLFAANNDDGSRKNEGDVYIGEQSDKPLLIQFYEWLSGDQPEDSVEYSALSSTEPDVQLFSEGLAIENLEIDATSLGDAEAVKLTIRDLNSGVISSDFLVNIDRVQLSERKDRVAPTSEWLNVPTLIDLGNFATGDISTADWDELDFSALSSGITMVNGTTRNRSEHLPDLVDGTGGVLQELASSLPFLFGFAPDILAFGAQENNNALRFTGAEKIIGSNHSDVLWFGEQSDLDQQLGGWPVDLEKPPFAEIDGGGGNDRIVFLGAEYIGAGELIPEAFGGAERVPNPDTGELEGGSIAATDLRTTIKGGEGDDRLFAFDGTGAETIGGEGRDFLFNTSFKGQIYGDTVDGTDEEFYDPENPSEHSDVFWYWPSPIINDARPNDILQLFGIPLLGGSNAIGGRYVGNGSLAMDWINWTMFYGVTDSGQLLIINAVAQALGIGAREGDPFPAGVMIVENYDFGGFRSAEWGRPQAGDLGFIFQFANDNRHTTYRNAA